MQLPVVTSGLAVLIFARLLPVVSCTPVSACPGYAATNIVDSGSTLTADLALNGDACNTYGYDLGNLSLLVEYQTGMPVPAERNRQRIDVHVDTRLHVKIFDTAEQAYQVPDFVVHRPSSSAGSNGNGAAVIFTYIADPFSFAVTRKGNSDALFNTTGWQLVFESQYLRLRTSLPPGPNLYGLGEHTDPFRLNTTDYTRTLWSRDAYATPPGTNLYSNHPVYFDHRSTGQTHAVFLLNSNGMDIKINRTAEDGQYLEYNTLGGVLDFYFLAGPRPLDVARQYSQVVGTPAMMPYWGLGFHQCRYGMQDVYEVAEVVANYSAAGIPLETMWTDIDYMDRRKVFTLDPERFPLQKVQELVTTLHSREQHYIVMVDPAVAYQDYPAFNNGVQQNVFLKTSTGSIYKGVVWPGVTAFPDWFNPDTATYWNSEFDTFFNAETGVDIDALWIDMNEAANFCPYPCDDPEGYASSNGFPPQPPPVRTTAPRPIPGFPSDFQPPDSASALGKRQGSNGRMLGLPNRDYITPPYEIHNAAGSLSNHTLDTSLVHYGGYVEYDTHNLYGTMMSSTSRGALLSRRPTVRPMVITRSTFAGAGTVVGHWLGDNTATWYAYRISIAEQLEFASIFQVPMVGADVCGFAQNTTENLCARWAMLGAFSSFYRNHAEVGKMPQEFYRWPMVAQAARNAIDIRYRMLDYLYTAMQRQSVDGTPWMNALWYLYPDDPNTFGVDAQFFFGPGLLVSPVTNADATSVSIYLPNDIFYDWYTFQSVRGSGTTIEMNNIDFTTIPLHIKGGSIIPLRIASANTTTTLRTKDFSILVAPGLDGSAGGNLYLDDGNSLVQGSTSDISFAFDGSVLRMTGSFGYDPHVGVAQVIFLGQRAAPSGCQVNGVSVGPSQIEYNQTSNSLTVVANATLMENLEVKLA